MDFFIDPDGTRKLLFDISRIIERFFSGIQSQTNSSSISVNRVVKSLEKQVFLHSECSQTMISTEQYEEFLLPIDQAWSLNYRPFGIHYCGKDPHRFAESYAKIGGLDFLDVGWGGDIKELRRHLPNTFLNIRLDPVTINDQSEQEIRESIIRLTNDSNNPYLTGICCINMDDKVEEKKVIAILKTVEELKTEFEDMNLCKK